MLDTDELTRMYLKQWLREMPSPSVEELYAKNREIESKMKECLRTDVKERHANVGVAKEARNSGVSEKQPRAKNDESPNRSVGEIPVKIGIIWHGDDIESKLKTDIMSRAHEAEVRAHRIAELDKELEVALQKVADLRKELYSNGF